LVIHFSLLPFYFFRCTCNCFSPGCVAFFAALPNRLAVKLRRGLESGTQLGIGVGLFGLLGGLWLCSWFVIAVVVAVVADCAHLVSKSPPFPRPCPSATLAVGSFVLPPFQFVNWPCSPFSRFFIWGISFPFTQLAGNFRASLIYC